MVTKIKPRRVKTDTTGSLGDALGYQDEATFQWGGAGAGDMRYADFNFTTESGGSVVLGLRTEISPSQNFTVAPPTEVKDGQTYILRVTNGATAYTMALTGGITNPHGVSLTLTPNSTDQFEFLAVGTTLELQPTDPDLSGVVMLTGDQTIAGTKTFSTSPVVPNKTTDATNTGTAIATEAQVYKKADAVDVNTKTFYLSGTGTSPTVLGEAQKAYDRYLSGKNAIISVGNVLYYFESATSSEIVFCDKKTKLFNRGSYSEIDNKSITMTISSGNITKVGQPLESHGFYFLDPSTSYAQPYIPPNNGAPATKIYVDSNDTHIGSSAPSNPVEGRLRYDTTNDVLKVYDGTNRNNVNTQVTVEDNLTSTSTTNALSANQGRILDGKIADLMALGKFLSLWDATTGQPISFPYTTPYAYSTGDYFLVETISSATPPVNYRPDGSSYTGTASSTPETDELEQGDVYIYDGSIWLLQSNHGKTVSFANIAGQPTDNTNLATALGNKQDTLSAGTGISISSNTVSNTGVTSVNSTTGAVTVQETLVSGTNIKTINSTSLLGSGDMSISEFAPSNAGTTDQILTKTAGGYERAAAPATGIQNDTTGTTTTVSAIWAGTEAEYNALQNYSTDIIYHIY